MVRLLDQLTSTMMDGHAVALDSESILSGLVEIRAASLVAVSGIKGRMYAIHFERETARIEVAVCDGEVPERVVMSAALG